MLIKCEIEWNLFFSCSDDQIVGTRFYIVHYFQRVRLNLIRISDIPHVKPLGEDDDGAADPVVVDQEMSIRHSIYLQPIKNILETEITFNQKPHAVVVSLYRIVFEILFCQNSVNSKHLNKYFTIANAPEQ